MSEVLKEFRVSNDALDDGEELRRRIAGEGYLFFRGLQDGARMLALRRDMLSVIAEAGWLVPGTDPADGIADPARACTEGDPEYTPVYSAVYKLESFHRAGHSPEVLDLMGKVIGQPVLPHPQKIARLWFPQFTDHTTPVHQDFVHFQGNFDTYTCWAPVGDCPIELGPLAILPGSHELEGVLDHHFSLGAGGLKIDPGELDGEWYSTDFEIGDTLVFNALMVHRALPNLTADRLRVSLDNRYQAVSGTIAEHMLQPHLQRFSGLAWDEVYAAWSGSRDLRYYWEGLGLETRPRDFSYAERGFEEAVALARQGDEWGRIAMQRVVRNNLSPPQVEIARAVLRELDAVPAE